MAFEVVMIDATWSSPLERGEVFQVYWRKIWQLDDHLSRAYAFNATDTVFQGLNSFLLSDMSKAGRITGSAGMELHGMDRAAGRTRAGDKSHLFIDQTRRGQLIHFNNQHY